MYEDKKKKPGGGKKIEGSYKKKGSAKETDAQEAKNLVDDMPVDEVAGASKGKKHHKKVVARKKGSAKKDMMMDEKPVARKKGAAQYKEEGAADFKGGLHAKNTKHSESGEHLGAKRMGFTQNFGPARQNSYAQGAARVAQIMGKGAFKKKGAADSGHGANPGHAHDRYISPERLDSNIQGTTSADMGMDLNEVVVSANSNTRKKKTKKKFKNTKVGKGLNAVGNFLNPSVPVYSRNKGKIVRTGVRTKLFGRQSMFTNLF